jgi:hypothetical protein
MRKGILLVICLLIAKLAICQDGYPKKVVINGDTVIAITIAQMTIINGLHISLEECREHRDSLLTTVDSCRLLSNLCDSTTTRLLSIISIQDTAIAEKTSIITAAESSNKKQQKEIKRLYNIGALYKVSTGVLGILAAILIFL